MDNNLYNGLPVYPAHSVIGLVSFKILNEDNEQVYQIKLNNEEKTIIKINAVVNIEPELLSELHEGDKARIYLEAYSIPTGAYIAFQHIQLPIAKIKSEETNLVNLTYKFEVPKNLTITNKNGGDSTFPLSAIIVRLAYSNKSSTEMGIGETMRIGTFLSTRIMVD